MERLRLAGKIGIESSVLHKPGVLDPDERAEMERHPAVGEPILHPIVEDETVLAMVRIHHERWGGQGYPDGLSGEGIPLGARILAWQTRSMP